MPFVKKISINFKLVLIISLFLFAESGFAQTMSIQASPKTGTVTITLDNVYSWAIQEENGLKWTTVYSGGAFEARTPITFTKPKGTYKYRLYNCFPKENGCSYSSVRTVLITVPDPVPAAPTLTAPATDADGTYSISWDSPQHTHQFVVEESLNSGSWSEIATTSANSRSFSGKGNGTWNYRVKACNGAGDCSSNSPVKSVKVTLVIEPAKFSYTYDALGRLIQTQKNSAIKTSYCYDKAGNRLSVSVDGSNGDLCANY
jgi:YD repeat-containing protein